MTKTMNVLYTIGALLMAATPLIAISAAYA